MTATAKLSDAFGPSDDVVMLTDEDIIETAPLPTSGVFGAGSLALGDQDEGELGDDVESETNVTDVASNLARLLAMDCVPRLSGEIDVDELEPHEAWFVSIVTGNTPMSVILLSSPLADEEIVRVVTSLVSKRAITLLPNP